MELKDIQELIKMVKKADISELKISEGEFTVTIKNKGNEATMVYTTQAQVTQPVMSQAPAITQAPGAQQSPAAQQTPKAETPAPAATNENLITFRSPMVGTFYRKPGADKEPYVKVGDAVKGGDVLCIIEAMKLFNEIEFDGGAGKIVKILVDDSSPVEYDQPLFLIEKS